MVAGQRALHQSLHPQAQAVQFVVDLQGGHAAGSVGLACGVVIVGPWPAGGGNAFVLRRLTVEVLPSVDGLEHAEVLLVAVERQHEAGVVHLVASPLFIVCVDLRGVLGVFQESVHPLLVLVEIQEGEMQRHAPARGSKEEIL